MIVYECPFDPVCDLEAVPQSGFLDLQDAWVNGVVPGDVSSSGDMYNNIEEPDAILGKPRDFADAYRMSKSMAEAAAHYESSSTHE